MRKYLPHLFAFLVIVTVSLPLLALAQEKDFSGLVVCDPTVSGKECGFKDLGTLAKRIINFMIILSTFVATAMFAYAGLILLTSGGDMAKMTKARTIFRRVGIGYLWILSAWLVVYTITTVLLESGFSILESTK